MDILRHTAMKRGKITIWLEDFVYGIIIRMIKIAGWVIDKQKERYGRSHL